MAIAVAYERVSEYSIDIPCHKGAEECPSSESLRIEDHSNNMNHDELLEALEEKCVGIMALNKSVRVEGGEESNNIVEVVTKGPKKIVVSKKRAKETWSLKLFKKKTVVSTTPTVVGVRTNLSADRAISAKMASNAADLDFYCSLDKVPKWVARAENACWADAMKVVRRTSANGVNFDVKACKFNVAMQLDIEKAVPKGKKAIFQFRSRASRKKTYSF